MQNKIPFFEHNPSHTAYYLKGISPDKKRFEISCMSCGVNSVLSEGMLFDVLSGLLSKAPEHQGYHFIFFDESVNGVWRIQYNVNGSGYLGFRVQDNPLRQIVGVTLGKQEILPPSDLTYFDPSVLEEKISDLGSNASLLYNMENRYYLWELFFVKDSEDS